MMRHSTTSRRVSTGTMSARVGARWCAPGSQACETVGRQAHVKMCSLWLSLADETDRYRSRYAFVTCFTLPALAENPPGGGAVFSGRTAGNDAYQPPADPPRQALSSCPAKSSRFLFLPPASRAISKSRISYYGIKEAEERRRTSIFMTAVSTLVGYSRRDPPALIPQRENRPQHATVEQRFLL